MTMAPAAPLDAAARIALAERLAGAGRVEEAETLFRKVLAVDRRNAQAAAGLSHLLLGLGRPGEALRLTRPLCGPGQTSAALLASRAVALKVVGDHAGALELYRRVVRMAPASGVAEHNVAAVLADLAEFEGAEAAARRAFGKGLDAPETWLVLARALQGQGRYDEAEAAYVETLRRRPLGPEAHRELAQLIWMRTADVGMASALLDRALAAAPDAAELVLAKARLLDHADRPQEARSLLMAAAARDGASAPLWAAASQAALASDPEAALALAERALAAAPGDAQAMTALCAARLAAGDGAGAASLAAELHARSPLDQHALALLGAAWRMTGDPRRAPLHDYDRLVRVYDIAPPPGWPTLRAYLAALAAELEALHGFTTHPIGQSLRHGSQTSVNLRRVASPAVRAFFQAIDGPIRSYIAALGPGPDPARARGGQDHEIAGAWSVLLRPGGRHVDHVHPEGWLSSAFYVALPEGLDGGGREGWLKFGEPGVPVRPAQGPEHFVRPAPGRLVLFPSYLWHGTVPFSAEGTRLTLAFDVKPKGQGLWR